MHAPEAEALSTSTPVVLCASEDRAFLNTARLNLGQAGFVVVTARSAEETLDLALRQGFDAAVCDYALSRLDGIALFARIKGRLGGATPPTLIVNDAYAAPLLANCIAAGAVGLHVKTDPPETLVERAIAMVIDPAKRRSLEKSAARRAVQGGTDPVTRVASKEHLARRFTAESAASYRDGNHISLIVLSVDRYTRIEERHGAQIAEGLLAQAARLIEGELRSRDCVGRISEHTFGVVLPETPLAAAAKVASRLRRTLATVELGDLDHPISITVSAGVSARPAGVRASPDELTAQAQKNCAAAAAMGGDRIVADAGLTGKPIALLLGKDDADETWALTGSLSMRGLEVRRTATLEEAQRVMTDVPAALVCAIRAEPDAEAEELLVWARTRFPSARRVLVSASPSPALMVRMVNEAAIDFLLLAPCSEASVDALVRDLIYS